MDESTRFILECNLRVYRSMLDLGHWTVGDKRAFTEAEIKHIENCIAGTEKMLYWSEMPEVE